MIVERNDQYLQVRSEGSPLVGFYVFLVAGLLCLLAVLSGGKNVLAGVVAGLTFLGCALAVSRAKIRQYTIDLTEKTLTWKYSTALSDKIETGNLNFANVESVSIARIEVPSSIRRPGHAYFVLFVRCGDQTIELGRSGNKNDLTDLCHQLRVLMREAKNGMASVEIDTQHSTADGSILRTDIEDGFEKHDAIANKKLTQ